MLSQSWVTDKLHHLMTGDISAVLIVGAAFYTAVKAWNGLEWWIGEDKNHCHKGEERGKSKKKTIDIYDVTNRWYMIRTSRE